MKVLEHRIRYHEVDKQGFLFNSRYFEIADVGMTEFFRLLGWDYDHLIESGVDPSVVNINADFFASAKFDDLLDVDVTCTKVGTKSFTLQTNIWRGEMKLALMEIIYANVNLATEKAIPLTEQVAIKLRSFVERPE
ncbi:MAG: hypothetical protein RIS09_633 [Actinomycetota bacterium]|jgi:acyl-CoA thioester hydrolase